MKDMIIGNQLPSLIDKEAGALAADFPYPVIIDNNYNRGFDLLYQGRDVFLAESYSGGKKEEEKETEIDS